MYISITSSVYLYTYIHIISTCTRSLVRKPPNDIVPMLHHYHHQQWTESTHHTLTPWTPVKSFIFLFNKPPSNHQDSWKTTTNKNHPMVWLELLQGFIPWLSSFPNIPTGRSPRRLKCGSGFIVSSSTTQSPEIRMSQTGRLRHFNHVNHQPARVLWMVVKLLSCRLLCQRLDMPRHDATKPSPQKRTLMLRGCGQRAAVALQDV